jgi:hypothetical protein
LNLSSKLSYEKNIYTRMTLEQKEVYKIKMGITQEEAAQLLNNEAENLTIYKKLGWSNFAAESAKHLNELKKKFNIQ